MFTSALLIVLSSGGARAWADAELKGSPMELAALLTNAPKAVYVTGEAELKVQADQALVSIRITTTAKELGQALRANQEAQSKFTRLLERQGLAPGQIK